MDEAQKWRKFFQNISNLPSKVNTTNSDTIRLTGTGTISNPLKAVFIGEAGTAANVALLDAASNAFTGSISAVGISSSTTIAATGAITGASLVTTGNISGVDVTASGNISGVNATLTGKISNTLITEQIKTSYDSSNYMTVTVGSAGSTTFELAGTSPQFTFGKQINITGGVTAVGGIQSSTTNTSANFACLSATSFVTTTVSQLLPTGASQIKARISERGTTNVALATNDSYIGHVIGEQGVTEAGAGTHAYITALLIKAPAVTTGAGASTNTSLLMLDVAGTTGTNNFGLYSLSKMGFDATMTAGGTTGNQTINKPSGSFNIAAGQTSVTITNNFVTSTSIVFTTLMTNDATARDGMACVVSSGSFVLTLDAATTAECKIGFLVIN